MSSSSTWSASPCVYGWLDCRCGCVRCRRVVHSVSSLILSDNVTFSRSTLKRIGAPNATQTFWPPALLMCCRDSRCFVSLFFFLPDNSLPEPPVQKMFSHYDTNRTIVRVDLDWELLFLSVGPDTPKRERALNQVSTLNPCVEILFSRGHVFPFAVSVLYVKQASGPTVTLLWC